MWRCSNVIIKELSVNNDEKHINVSYDESEYNVYHVKLLDDTGSIVSVSSDSDATLAYPESDEEYELIAVLKNENTVKLNTIRT